MSDKPLLDIGAAEWSIVQSILQLHVPGNEVWAFGSRVKWTAKEFSDLDLAIIGQTPLKLDVCASLAEDFSNSDLPWKVDVVDWATTSEAFREIIRKDKVVVQSLRNGGKSAGKSSEWREVLLGDCVELTTGFPFKSANYAEEGIRLLRGDNIAQGKIRWDGVKFLPTAKAKGIEEYLLKQGDIVLAMDRPWIAAGLKFSTVRDSDIPSLLVQRVARMRPMAGVEATFLHCIVASPDFSQYIQNVTTGTAVPHISAKQIREHRFRLPNLSTQCAIGSTIKCLEDRIALLRETNTTLEGIAQALFKSWFVDFDPVRAKIEGRVPEGMDEATAGLFPDSFEESELGLVPKGWRVQSLDKIASFLNGLALQKFPPTGQNDLPVIKIAQLRKGDSVGADKASRYIKPEYIVKSGDVLFSWSGSLEVEIWCGGDGALNQHLFKVTSEDFPKWFYFFWTRQHLADFRQTAASKATTMGHIQRGHLTAAKVFVPNDAVIGAATSVLGPIVELLIENSLRIQNLASMRDTLLPRLISGQLRVTGSLEELEAA